MAPRARAAADREAPPHPEGVSRLALGAGKHLARVLAAETESPSLAALKVVGQNGALVCVKRRPVVVDDPCFEGPLLARRPEPLSGADAFVVDGDAHRVVRARRSR